jgi:hypothetical protein
MFGGIRNSYLEPCLNTKSTSTLGLFDRDSRLGYFIFGQKAYIGLTGDSHEHSS